METNKHVTFVIKEDDNVMMETLDRNTILSKGSHDDSLKLKNYIKDVADNNLTISRRLGEFEVDVLEFVFDGTVNLKGMEENIGLEVEISF